jgi:hypothetical protein
MALSGTRAQTLFTFGNQSVSKEEFLKAYNKNKTPCNRQRKIFARIP